MTFQILVFSIVAVMVTMMGVEAVKLTPVPSEAPAKNLTKGVVIGVIKR